MDSEFRFSKSISDSDSDIVVVPSTCMLSVKKGFS